MTAIELYQVRFTTEKIFTTVIPVMYSTNEALSSYIFEHNNLLLANALINEINTVLEGNKFSGGWDTQGMMVAKVTALETKIYNDVEAWANNEQIMPDCILPTTDFKIIVAAWLEFLKII